MPWPRNDLTELLGIDYPILLAPMGESTPALASAVSAGWRAEPMSTAKLPKLRRIGSEVRSISPAPGSSLNVARNPKPVRKYRFGAEPAGGSSLGAA